MEPYGVSWREALAEEVGVEPTSHFYSSSTALKAARPTGDDALPFTILAKKRWCSGNDWYTVIWRINVLQLIALIDRLAVSCLNAKKASFILSPVIYRKLFLI